LHPVASSAVQTAATRVARRVVAMTAVFIV
jgi:hypothetical protein